MPNHKERELAGALVAMGGFAFVEGFSRISSDLREVNAVETELR